MQRDHDLVSDEAKGDIGDAVAFRRQIGHVRMQIRVMDIEGRFGVRAGDIH